MNYPVYTDRLTLRRFVPEDWCDLFEYLSDPETVFYEPYEPFSAEDAKNEATRRQNDDSFIAVCLNDKLIGNIYFSSEGDGVFEIGYVFNRKYWGKGYASEAAREIIRLSFENGAKKIIAGCASQNPNSYKLLERLGMRLVEEKPHGVTFKKDKDGNDIWFDTRKYELVR